MRKHFVLILAGVAAAWCLTAESCAGTGTPTVATDTPAAATDSPAAVGGDATAPAATSQPNTPAPTSQVPAAAPAPNGAVPPTSGFDHAAAQQAGASAICNDGWWSISQHRSGTCSSHDGVNWWTGNLGAAGPG